MKVSNKKTNKVLAIAFLSALSMSAFAESGAIHHSGQASKHTVLSTAHTVGSTAKVASAVVAVPIIVAGGASIVVGSGSVAVGSGIADSAKNLSVHEHHHQAPLEITELTITADPAPNQVANIDKAEQNNIRTTEIEIQKVITTQTRTEVETTKLNESDQNEQ